MKWIAEWWGIVLLAETDEDSALLKQVSEIVPQRAEEYYDEGAMTIGDGPYIERECKGEYPCITWVEFWR